MSFEFVIPLLREDLHSRTSLNQYVVDEVLHLRILPTKIQECQSSFRSCGPQVIIKYFDAFFSVLKFFQDVTPDLKEDAWKLLLKSMVMHANQMVETLDSSLDPETRQQHLNILKMTTYLMCQFIEMFEAVVSKPPGVISGKGRKKSQRHSEDLGNMNWDAEREHGIRALLQMLQLNVSRLWEPPVMEEEFVNLVTNTCYKMLENPAVCRDKTTRDTVLRLLGIMVKKYNHGLSCSMKIVQLLQHFEHLPIPMAMALELFATEYGKKSVTGEVMREIGRIDPQDLARDSSGTKAYAVFLVELAERIPAIMMPNIAVLLGLLDEESYMMRNSILGVLAEIVIRVLSKDDLDEKQKAARDQFLDKLEDHIHDVNAFTRSKSLQIWLHIVNEKALPIQRQHGLLELVIGRLQDKSSFVRKNSVLLLTAMLTSNPFAAKLPHEELKAKYEMEKAKLLEMTPEVADDPAMALKAKLEEEWERIEKKVSKAIAKAMKRKEDEDEEMSEASGSPRLSEEDTVTSVMEKILSNLKDGQYDAAASTLMRAQEEWPMEKVFGSAAQLEQRDNRESEDEDEQECRLKKEKLMKLTICLKAIYMGEELAAKVLEIAANIEKGQQESPDKNMMNEVTRQQVLVQYLRDSMTFVSQIQRAVPIISQLLGSKNTTDVMEAIDFFVTGFEFGVSNVMVGIRRMLSLIWSKEASIKEAVVDAYKRLYLSQDESNSKAYAIAVANNLIALTLGASLGDITSLEELIVELMKSGHLDSSIIQTLWEKFALKIPNTSAQESCGALTLLGMAAGADVDIVRSNIDVLVKEGLGIRAESDFILVRNTCLVLAKLSGQKKERGKFGKVPFRLPQDHEIFKRLAHLLVSGLELVELPCWIPMAEQAVSVIYQLAEHPDAICGEVLKQMAVVVIKYNQQRERPAAKASEQEVASQPTVEGRCPAGVLTRLISLVGQVALCQLVHIDVAILGEMKRRQELQDEEGRNKCQKSTLVSNNRKKNKTMEEELTAEEELGLAGASADDMECEYIRRVTETELVNGESSLLSVFRPLLLAICNNPKKYTDFHLQAAATLALAKFMCVSSEFCESHLQLLFTVLEKSPSATIRANTIIALGDLTFRFPNLIEPWTPNLYARLRDNSPKVRKNTLMVLTHLILNDMVKVKGQISELATCIVDEDEKIASLAKLFFHELAKKGNAIYNIMPDMISRLSDPDVGVPEDNFRTVMKYLFGFIQKDRQCESLVEKLCHRFRATRVDRQWRDLAFCLSMLTYNEKSMRKLQENFACFADKLADQDVYQSFMTIMAGAKKFAKPEVKSLVDELGQHLEECHLKGVDAEEVAANAFKALQTKNRRRSSKKSPGKGQGRYLGKTPSRAGRTLRPKKKLRSVESDEDQMEEEDDESEEDFQPSRRGKKIKGKPKLSFTSEDESDEEEEVDVRKGKGSQSTKEVVKKCSDDENKDPNVSDGADGSDSSPVFIKKRIKSVNTKNVRQSAELTRRSQRKPSGRK